MGPDLVGLLIWGTFTLAALQCLCNALLVLQQATELVINLGGGHLHCVDSVFDAIKAFGLSAIE